MIAHTTAFVSAGSSVYVPGCSYIDSMTLAAQGNSCGKTSYAGPHDDHLEGMWVVMNQRVRGGPVSAVGDPIGQGRRLGGGHSEGLGLASLRVMVG